LLLSQAALGAVQARLATLRSRGARAERLGRLLLLSAWTHRWPARAG